MEFKMSKTKSKRIGYYLHIKILKRFNLLFEISKPKNFFGGCKIEFNFWYPNKKTWAKMKDIRDKYKEKYPTL